MKDDQEIDRRAAPLHTRMLSHNAQTIFGYSTNSFRQPWTSEYALSTFFTTIIALLLWVRLDVPTPKIRTHRSRWVRFKT